jgi:drug/metabolite transporter (DMT)-like permease
MLNNWLFLIILSGLASNFFNTILRRTLKDGRDSTAYAWWFELFRFIFFVLFTVGLFLCLFLLQSVLVAHVGSERSRRAHTYMKMHSLTELSISSIITRLRSIWVAILAFAILGERLTLWQYVGVATVVLGTLVVQHSYKLRLDKSMKVAIIFTLASAISTIIMKHTTTYASVTVINIAFSLPSVVLLPMLMKNPLSRIKTTLPVTFRSSLSGLSSTISPCSPR